MATCRKSSRSINVYCIILASAMKYSLLAGLIAALIASYLAAYQKNKPEVQNQLAGKAVLATAPGGLLRFWDAVTFREAAVLGTMRWVSSFD